MARRALAVLGGLLVVGGAAAVVYGLTRRPEGGEMAPRQIEAMTTAIGQLDGDVKAARAAVRERATTLARLPVIAASVQTDAATARDQVVRGELRFDPQPGEVVEIGQLVGGKPTTLLVEPDGGLHSKHAGAAGGFAELVGDRLLITEVATVRVGGRDAGYVMVSRPLELASAIQRLVAAGVTGRVELGAASLPIGTVPVGEVVTKSHALPSQPDAVIVGVMAAPRGGSSMTMALAGGGAATLGLVLVVLAMVRRPADAKRAAGETRYSAPVAVAAGTPASFDSRANAGTAPGAVGTTSIAPSGLGAGAMIGRWEIVRRLGSGGMADVFLARARGDAGFEKLVALKVMHAHLARNERAVSHFLDEARLAARVVHPNVVAILDLGKIGDDYVIVMEFVDGVDLERVLLSARAAERPVPVDVALGLLCRICDGLHAAHQATAPDGSPLGIIHRDVKSANVLVSKQGGVKVVDFGIAKAAQQSHLTIAGETKGTPSMMAPEQRVGEQVDVRADVYAAAAVGYEVLTGHGVNLDLAALAHLGVDNWPHLPLPTSLRAQLPSELDELLLGAMAFERERRPADCAALEAAFAAVMRKHNLSATDKDISRWLVGELERLAPPQVAPARAMSKPPHAS